MRTTSITIRTDPRLKRALTKLVKQLELSISDYLNMLMRASVEGKVRVGFVQDEEFEYPEWYARELEEESKETMRLYREGKIKGYSGPGAGKRMLCDILGDDAP